MNILILYSTTDGQTKKIAQRLEQHFHQHSNTTTLQNLNDYLQSPSVLTNFDVVILGASIRYGKHQKAVARFITQQQQALAQTLFAFYSVNLTARKPEKNTPESNPYMMKFYAKLPIKPQIDAVFAGRLAYPEYTWYDRMMIRFIMRITKGPTDPTTVKEFTDWQAVENYAEKIRQHLLMVNSNSEKYSHAT